MFYPKSFSIIFVWYMFTLGWTGGIVCESAKIDLRQSCLICYVLKWENVLNVSNEMHCIILCFLQKQSHTRTHRRAQMFFDTCIFDISYLDMCGMINFVRDVIWICKDRINTQILIVLFKHHISNFGANPFLHSRKQCLLFIQAWTHTTQKWY